MTVQRLNWTATDGKAILVTRVILGIVLFTLVSGLWACLWVPPWPIF